MMSRWNDTRIIVINTLLPSCKLSLGFSKNDPVNEPHKLVLVVSFLVPIVCDELETAALSSGALPPSCVFSKPQDEKKFSSVLGLATNNS